jgi:two-component system response regulator
MVNTQIERATLCQVSSSRTSSLEVLQWLRRHEEFKRIPTLVLTSSRVERDVASAYGFGANSYLVKPTTLHDLEQLGRVIRDYWENCEIPAGEAT